jgi:hypothetical protein
LVLITSPSLDADEVIRILPPCRKSHKNAKTPLKILNISKFLSVNFRDIEFRKTVE